MRWKGRKIVPDDGTYQKAPCNGAKGLSRSQKAPSSLIVAVASQTDRHNCWSGFSLESEMTLAEFKAWFEGFSELMEGAPSEKQWERIKARVAEIDGSVTTYPVFVERYIPPYRRWYDGVWMSGPIVGCGSPTDGIGAIGAVAMTSAAAGEDMSLSFNSKDSHQPFDQMSAMMDLGKAEYRSLNS